jgi:stage V sporulation protein D (sporulation-specific penicillin-binding protein)
LRERYPELRWRGLAALIGIAFCAVFLRLGWIQVVRGSHWERVAELSSTEVQTIEARRGRLLDRRGQVLARTEILTTVGVARPHEWLATDYPSEVAGQIGIPEPELRRRLAGRRSHTVIVRDALLDAHQRQALRCIPNMSVDTSVRRVRPHGDLARHVLGNVSRAGEGVSGLERTHDEILAGTPGEGILRQDGLGGLRSRVTRIEPVDGSDVVSTLDLRVQAILERELEAARDSIGANAAQGIVLEAATGEVIALAQAPFRTPAPDGSDEIDRWRVMAATDEFEPGSVFKIFTLATLLSESVVDTSTVFDGMGRPGDRRTVHVFANGRRIRDVHPVGKVSIRHAFVTSSNIVFARAVEERLRSSEFYDAIRRFGFTERPGTGFRAEADGLLLDRDRWTSYMMQSLAMGQGISVTLLQLASASAAVLGDGNLRSPVLAREIVAPDGRRTRVEATIRRRAVVTPRVTAKLRACVRDVVHESYGTGENARVDGLSVGGKTSTAQISDEQGYIEGIYTPIFVGAVPAEDPRLIVVIVLHGAPGERTYGGNTAAPCFARVVGEIAARTPWLESAFEVARVEPTETIPAPELVGRTVQEVRELSADSLWSVEVAHLPDEARAVSQIPAPGMPMRPGARVQLAWSGARR